MRRMFSCNNLCTVKGSCIYEEDLGRVASVSTALWSLEHVAGAEGYPQMSQLRWSNYRNQKGKLQHLLDGVPLPQWITPSTAGCGRAQLGVVGHSRPSVPCGFIKGPRQLAASCGQLVPRLSWESMCSPGLRREQGGWWAVFVGKARTGSGKCHSAHHHLGEHWAAWPPKWWGDSERKGRLSGGRPRPGSILKHVCVEREKQWFEYATHQDACLPVGQAST